MGRFELRDRIAGLDPDRDFEEIYRLLVFHEFPWDLRVAGATMIWHLFANPSTAVVVGATDALVTRSAETALVFGDLIEYGLDSPRGRATIRLINRSHRAYHEAISVEDHRYALASLVVTAVRWLDRHAWRRTTANERAAIARFYQALGARMAVTGLPADYPALAAYVADCERDRIGYSDAGRLCSDRTLELARISVPWPLGSLAVAGIGVLLGPQIRAATGVREPGRLLVGAVAALLWLRRRVVRWLPQRRRPTTPRTRRGLGPAPEPGGAHHHRGGVNRTQPGLSAPSMDRAGTPSVDHVPLILRPLRRPTCSTSHGSSPPRWRPR
jgi:hypothetical protein